MNTLLKSAYSQRQKMKLFDAETKLAEKGIRSMHMFLESHTETIEAAERIALLEQVAAEYQKHSPTLYVFVSQNTSCLLEGKNNPDLIKSVMINYAFICEALGKCIKEAAAVFAEKHPATKSLHELYGKSSAQLLEFCIRKAYSHKLLEANSDQLVANIASELSHMPIGSLKTLCESIPKMRLYVSGNIFKELVGTVLVG